MQTAYRDARRAAAVETGLSDNVFSTDCLWTAEQILNPNFLP